MTTSEAGGDPAGIGPGKGLSVHGGRGGTQAWLDDLDRAAGAMLRAGERVGAVALQVLSVTHDSALLVTALASPVTAAQAEVAVLAAATGPHGAATAALRLEALGGGLEAAVRAYRAVDATVAGILHGIDQLAGRVTGQVTAMTAAAVAPFALTTAAGAVLGARLSALTGPAGRGGPDVLGPGRRLLSFVGRHATFAQHAVDAVPGFVGGLVEPPPIAGPGWVTDLAGPPRDARAAAMLLSGLADRVPSLREPVRVRTISGPPLPVAPPTGLADVLARVASASPGSPEPSGAVAPPGTVRVERITHRDGSRAWVVEIPGTHVWSLTPGADPFDAVSDVHALGGRPSAAGAGVLQALRAAGVRPDEPVLLAGHSLGGMVAAELAADPGVRSEFRITHVVTAGSPVALSPVPRSVHVLSLEHTDDLVPRLDGAPNPDRAQWLTVTRSVTPAGPGPAEAMPTPGDTHAVRTYVRTAALVDASADPSLATFREELAPFVDAPGASATAWFVRTERVVTP